MSGRHGPAHGSESGSLGDTIGPLARLCACEFRPDSESRCRIIDGVVYQSVERRSFRNRGSRVCPSPPPEGGGAAEERQAFMACSFRARMPVRVAPNRRRASHARSVLGAPRHHRRTGRPPALPHCASVRLRRHHCRSEGACVFLLDAEAFTPHGVKASLCVCVCVRACVCAPDCSPRLSRPVTAPAPRLASAPRVASAEPHDSPPAGGQAARRAGPEPRPVPTRWRGIGAQPPPDAARLGPVSGQREVAP